MKSKIHQFSSRSFQHPTFHSPLTTRHSQPSTLIACSWSGGKDSCYALMRAIAQGHQLSALVNMMNENGKISRSHGLPLSVLQQQAATLNVPIVAVPTSWNDYRENFITALRTVHSQYGVQSMVFGDIDLQPHRDWEENVCKEAGLQAILPLWQRNRRELVNEMIESGIEAIIVSCNTQMGQDFLGRAITHELADELEAAGIDACGENGEYHTAVVNCPLFAGHIQLPQYEKVLHENYWFLKWHDE
ncbi:MAG TPA: diphthine--ammonia ligase [Chitinophagaceae bacterium]|nr:diphthine--ammonia ligase [Chitinophagaceae bacterium]